MTRGKCQPIQMCNDLREKHRICPHFRPFASACIEWLYWLTVFIRATLDIHYTFGCGEFQATFSNSQLNSIRSQMLVKLIKLSSFCFGFFSFLLSSDNQMLMPFHWWKIYNKCQEPTAHASPPKLMDSFFESLKPSIYLIELPEKCVPCI